MTSNTNMNNTRKYYALLWLKGYEFEFDYDTLPKLETPVANIVVFTKKRNRDDYVDSRHCCESIPAVIARKMIRNGVSYFIASENR